MSIHIKYILNNLISWRKEKYATLSYALCTIALNVLLSCCYNLLFRSLDSTNLLIMNGIFMYEYIPNFDPESKKF